MEQREITLLKEIRQDLEHLKAIDKEFRVFGARLHQYMSVPVTVPELEHLENELSVRLPDEYRQFLLEIGAGPAPARTLFGGAGPYYGLFGPETMLHELIYTFGFVDQYRQNASKPFPLDHVQAEECYQIMEEGRFASFLGNWPPEGCIPICHEGCSFYTCLVTSGELRGSLWSTSFDMDIDYKLSWNLAPMPPGILDLHTVLNEYGLEDALSPLPTFLEWYGAWIHHCLSDFEQLKNEQN